MKRDMNSVGSYVNKGFAGANCILKFNACELRVYVVLKAVVVDGVCIFLTNSSQGSGEWVLDGGNGNQP